MMHNALGWTEDEPALQALAYALEQQAWPAGEGACVCIGGRAGTRLSGLAGADWQWIQSFKPWAEALQREGREVEAELPAETRFAQILLYAPRQREQIRAALARSVSQLQPGGILAVAAANDEGAASLIADLQALAGVDGVLSKHKCRVGWVAVDPAQVDTSLLAEWLRHDMVRLGPAGFHTRPGLFGWDRVDPGSALLSQCLPTDLTGRIADLGAGYGYLSAWLLSHSPQLQQLDAYEAEARALEPARRNLAAACQGRLPAPQWNCYWHDVSTGLPASYDVIVSNPPFHAGRADRPELGQAFIHAAAGALHADGQCWLVANRHLPYEALLAQRFGDVQTVASEQGYKVFRAIHPR